MGDQRSRFVWSECGAAGFANGEAIIVSTRPTTARYSSALASGSWPADCRRSVTQGARSCRRTRARTLQRMRGRTRCCASRMRTDLNFATRPPTARRGAIEDFDLRSRYTFGRHLHLTLAVEPRGSPAAVCGRPFVVAAQEWRGAPGGRCRPERTAQKTAIQDGAGSPQGGAGPRPPRRGAGSTGVRDIDRAAAASPAARRGCSASWTARRIASRCSMSSAV